MGDTNSDDALDKELDELKVAPYTQEETDAGLMRLDLSWNLKEILKEGDS